MCQIWLDNNKWIVEYSHCLEKVDFVLEKIGSGLAIIPLKSFQFQFVFL